MTVYVPSKMIEMVMRAFIIFCPGNTIGLPLTNPCNLPKAIKLPVNVSVPTNTLMAIVAALNVDGFAGLKYSAAATKADAPPPNPLKIATICGI